MRSLLLSLGLLAGPALVQDDWQPDWDLTADLDGDEIPETYELRDNVQGSVDWWCWGPGRSAWCRGSPGMAGQEPELSVNHAGSLLVNSKNESIGRDRWRITLTVAHRDGDLRVAGTTYD